jgi:spore germination cell wall hydrolase CwlJ-like protein
MIAEALVCLALNIYHEARNQPTIGQIAVAQVVANRVNDSRYPNNVCDVVYQGLHYEGGHPIIHKCQFSWYCDGKTDEPKDKEAYEYAMSIAKKVVAGNSFRYLDGATHYHTTEVAPAWASGKKFIVRINDHLFYRWE